MNQGNIGLFENDAGQYRWLWKVRRPGALSGSQSYYDVVTGEEVPIISVTDCTKDGFRNEWAIVYELTPEEALAKINFIAVNPDEYRREKTAEELYRKKVQLEEKLECAYDNVMNAIVNWKSAISKRDALKEAIEDVEAQINALDTDARDLYLVHASHTASDDVDYTWWADKELAEQLKPGDLISVETSRGIQPAIVRRVEVTRNWAPHKKVIGIINSGGS